MAWYWYIPLISCLSTLLIVVYVKELTFYTDQFLNLVMQVKRAAQSLFAVFVIIPFLFIFGGFIIAYMEWIEPNFIDWLENRRHKKSAAKSGTSK
ncbi:MAG: hypothetical protein KAZ30_00850 [Candidatus Magasanikbacteria bacterium]|nr:hypothetical protein [Candidatus Magasanikbacteria bacterium]